MRFTRILAIATLCGIAAPYATAAEPPPASQITVVGPGGASVVLNPDELARMATTRITVSYETAHGAQNNSFEGPLLWDVLTRTGAIDANKPRDAARPTVMITATDGYAAAVAIGEISPGLEGKQVILAVKMNDKPIEPGHLRIVVPLDHRGERDVHEVTRIEVIGAGPQPH
jgi:DMSO/TMAO reductase YedYZ molybdopterin-dependent catalytic subunit